MCYQVGEMEEVKEEVKEEEQRCSRWVGVGPPPWTCLVVARRGEVGPVGLPASTRHKFSRSPDFKLGSSTLQFSFNTSTPFHFFFVVDSFAVTHSLFLPLLLSVLPSRSVCFVAAFFGFLFSVIRPLQRSGRSAV